MNILPRDKQVEIISALCEGIGQRAVARLTGTNRKTVARLALRVGRGCAELHDRMMVGLRVHRIECDELWSFVGHKRNPQRGSSRQSPVFGDQYTFIALASSTRAIIGYRTGKRDAATTDEFIQDLRSRVLGLPEISTDGALLPASDPRCFRQARGARRDPEDVFGNTPECHRSIPPLFAGHGSGGHARNRERRSG